MSISGAPFFCEFGCLIAVHILAETEHIYLIGNIFLINKFHFVISSLRNATEISYSVDMKTRWKKKRSKVVPNEQENFLTKA